MTDEEALKEYESLQICVQHNDSGVIVYLQAWMR
jgi:hypothetical protein